MGTKTNSGEYFLYHRVNPVERTACPVRIIDGKHVLVLLGGFRSEDPQYSHLELEHVGKKPSYSVRRKPLEARAERE